MSEEEKPDDSTDYSRRSAIKTISAASIGSMAVGGIGSEYLVDRVEAASAPTWTENWADDYRWQYNSLEDLDATVTTNFGVAQMDKGQVSVGCEDQDHWGYRFGIFGLGLASAEDGYGGVTGGNFVEGQSVDIDSEKVCGSNATIEPFDSYAVEPDGSQFDTFLGESHYKESDSLDTFSDVEYWCNEWESDTSSLDKVNDFSKWGTGVSSAGLLAGAAGLTTTAATLGIASTTLGTVSLIDSYADYGTRNVESSTDTSITISKTFYNRPMALQYVDFRAYVPPNTTLDINVSQSVDFRSEDGNGNKIETNIDSDACYTISIPSSPAPSETSSPSDASVSQC